MNLHPELNATIVAALASIGTDDKLRDLGIKNGRVSSARTVSFELPSNKHYASLGEPMKMVNRVKLTAHSDGTVDVRLVEDTKLSTVVPLVTSIEHDVTERIEADKVGSTLYTKIALGA